MHDFLANHCDGAGPHSGTSIKRYPLGGGGNLHLCFSCWANENRYRHMRGVEQKNPEAWPQVNWYEAETVYTATA